MILLLMLMVIRMMIMMMMMMIMIMIRTQPMSDICILYSHFVMKVSSPVGSVDYAIEKCQNLAFVNNKIEHVN